MKNMFLVTLILTSVTGRFEARAATMRTDLECEHQSTEGYTNVTVAGDIASMAHNYSWAKMICPGAEIRQIKNGQSFLCYGLMDDRVLAWLKIFKKNGRIQAQTQTSVFYGSKMVELACETREVQGD